LPQPAITYLDHICHEIVNVRNIENVSPARIPELLAYPGRDQFATFPDL
jgi:hypothetical protein